MSNVIMLENLIPVSDNHSITKAVATIFAPQHFIKPEDLLAKYNVDNRFESYKKKSPLKSTTINFGLNQVGISSDENRGLLFESFTNDGALDSTFRVENLQENRSTISVETRNYYRWENFEQQIKRDFKEFASSTLFYVEAINLSYTDEFDWIDKNSHIACELIFKNDSEYLNSNFLKAQNGSLISLVQGQSAESGTSFEEKIEVSFNNDIKKLAIVHNYAFRLNKIETFEKAENTIYPLFKMAHIANKNVLKELLTDEVLQRINFK